MGLIPTLNTFVAGTPIVASAMNSNFDAIVAVVNGGIDDSNVSQISASKVTSGEFHPDRIPRLSEDKLPRAAQGFLKAKGASADPAYELVQWGDVQAKPAQATRWPTWSEVSDRPSTFPPAGHTHNAGDINSGTFAAARIPNLDAGKITSGVFGAPRLSALFGSGGTAGTDRVNINATRINSGTLDDARIPDLNASKITAGTLSTARIPNLDASKITAGIMQRARLPVGAHNTDDVAPGQSMTGSGTHQVGCLRLVGVHRFGTSGATMNPGAALNITGTAGQVNGDEDSRASIVSINVSGDFFGVTAGTYLPNGTTWQILNRVNATPGDTSIVLAVRIS